MKLSVIMPVYNEKNTIKSIIRKVMDVKLEKELIIVDDFSTDGTRKILEKIQNENIKIIYQDKNYGKGYGIRSGLQKSSGDIIIIQDADLEYDPNDYYNLIKSIVDGKTKVVYGTRFPKGSKKPPLTNPFYLANKILTLVSNILYNSNITDEATCYKVFDARVIKSLNLRCKRFEFCPEVTAKIRKKGYRIYEVPIKYKARTVKDDKKIKSKDGFEALWTLIKYRFLD